MSRHSRSDRPQSDSTREGPLGRWSRRKREAGLEKAGESLQEAGGGAPGLVLHSSHDADTGDGSTPVTELLTDDDMPDIDSLDDDSDYAGFLSPGVSEALRKQALRRMFRSAAFNVCDGLDDYDEDFTSFEKLGDIITADMRHRELVEEERRVGESTLPEDIDESESEEFQNDQSLANKQNDISPDAVDSEEESCEADTHDFDIERNADVDSVQREQMIDKNEAASLLPSPYEEDREVIV